MSSLSKTLRLAPVAAALLLGNCEFGTAPGAAQQSASERPSIAYDSLVTDTVGKAVSHPVLSLGGQVTSYAFIVVNGSQSIFPKGLSLNTKTGLISGVPEIPHDAPTGNGWATSGATYYIQATGPGGRDTAAISIYVGWQGPTGAVIKLTVNLLADGISPNVLVKSSALTVKKMVVTLISNVPTDRVVRDTIWAGASGLGTWSAQIPAFSSPYEVKPLRNWTVSVKTLDARDSILHEGTATVNNLLAGESRSVTVDAAVRFDTYDVRFALPDSLASGTGTGKQAVGFMRVRVLLDGAVVRDTLKASGYFAASPNIHVMEYDYVRPVSHLWKVEIYGNIEGWLDKPLFTGSITLPLAPCPACVLSPMVSMAWTGPGATITTRPVVTIQKVNVAISGDDFGPGGPLPKRAAPVDAKPDLQRF
jgi:hypothetical protein